jgi:two-component system response regulator HydG
MSAEVTQLQQRGKVLVVDDDPDLCRLLATYLAGRGYSVVTRSSAEAAWSALESDPPDVVITDLQMPGESGAQLCSRIVQTFAGLPVLVMTAYASVEAAVEAMRAGAEDFVTKPIRLDALELRLQRALQRRALVLEVERLRKQAVHAAPFEEILGQSPPMLRLYDLLDQVAPSNASLLVTGESGTGKELVARAVHKRSKRSAGPFLAINCAAMPEQLLESELFGHAKGAFTDASRSRVGLLQQADGGTVFLDEIGELPLAMQPKLLRALQEKKVRPVGGNEEVPFDARIITATNRDLDTEVEEGRFREDLYFRLNVIHIDLPPLRARGSDVLVLGQQFLQTVAAQAQKTVRGFSSSAAEKLLAWPWPGNVRELQNCIERAVALTRGEEISAEDLPEKLRRHRPQQVLADGADLSSLTTLAEVERRYILLVLDAVGGNKTLAASKLGLDRKTLYRKLEQYQREGAAGVVAGE